MAAVCSALVAARRLQDNLQQQPAALGADAHEQQLDALEQFILQQLLLVQQLAQQPLFTR